MLEILKSVVIFYQNQVPSKFKAHMQAQIHEEVQRDEPVDAEP